MVVVVVVTVVVVTVVVLFVIPRFPDSQLMFNKLSWDWVGLSLSWGRGEEGRGREGGPEGENRKAPKIVRRSTNIGLVSG